MSRHTRQPTRLQQSSPGGELAAEASQEQVTNPLEDTLAYVREYARDKPEIAALWCFGVGFILGWKLKPW